MPAALLLVFLRVALLPYCNGTNTEHCGATYLLAMVSVFSNVTPMEFLVWIKWEEKP